MIKPAKVLASVLSAAMIAGVLPPEALLYAAQKGLDPAKVSANPAAHAPARISALRLTTPAGTTPVPLIKTLKTSERAPALAPGAARLALEDAGTGPSAPNGEAAPDRTGEQASADAARPFENPVKSASVPVEGKPSLATRLVNRLANSRLGRYVSPSLAARLNSPVKIDFKIFPSDEYGGPHREKLNWSGQVVYGLQSGLNLVGLATVLRAASRLLAGYEWQLHLSKGLLPGLGRVELLTRYGPAQIAQALGDHPLRFLAGQLAVSAVREEIAYRLLAFGGPLILLASARPLTAALSKRLNSLPDIYPLRELAQEALLWLGKISGKAFPLAALYSAAHFTAAHFALWGVSPARAAAHMTLGLGLAWTAYRTRSLVSSATAHFVFNFLSLLGGLFLYYHMPAAAKVYPQLLSVASLTSLYYTFRSYEKAHTQAVATSARRIVKLLLAAILTGSAASTVMHSPAAHARHAAKAVKTAAAKASPAPAAEEAKAVPSPLPEAAKPATLTEITAKAKPAVLEIIVPGVGLGTGFIVTPEGLAVTNAHVAGPAGLGNMVIVELTSGQRLPAKVVALNRDRDLALIQLIPKNPNGWPVLPLSDNAATAEGDEVLALGHPMGLPFSVSRGIVSGLAGDRGNLYVRYIQTDAAINPGNSGGPLLNMKGEVIGVNSSGIGELSSGISFSITAQDVKIALKQFAETGNINSSWLGIIVDASNPLPPDQGVLIEQVRPGSPAARAGLRPGDVILGIDGALLPPSPQESLQALAKALAEKLPRAEMRLIVAHAGRVLMTKVVLADKQ